MRGELYLGWSPLAGKWYVVHVEPQRITSNDDYRKLGRVSRLAFYMGGKKIHSYSQEDLDKMGLQRKVQTLVHRQTGQFLVRGIRQIPRTNHYVFVIEKISANGHEPVALHLDITTGKTATGHPSIPPTPGTAAAASCHETASLRWFVSDPAWFCHRGKQRQDRRPSP